MHILCDICTNSFIPKAYIWYESLKAYENQKKDDLDM